jgi:hypothetical protein
MRSFVLLSLALPSVLASVSTVWLSEAALQGPYVSCVGADQCYCGTISGYTVSDTCQTSAPASITSALDKHQGLVVNGITGAILYGNTAWVFLGDGYSKIYGKQVTGGTTVPSPTPAASSTGSTATTTSAQTSTNKAAAGPAAAAMTGVVGVVAVGIAAGAALL